MLFFKVRPILENINSDGRWIKNCSVGGRVFSIDETMVPIYGPYRAKQFIYDKPIRFDYKVCKNDMI